jgi:hypothetical protein
MIARCCRGSFLQECVMERERIEKFIGKRVRVDLNSGQNLPGELRVPAFSPRQFEVVESDGTHALFWEHQVADIMLLHPAEEAAMERECTCNEEDMMSWTTCPLHRYEEQ